MESTLQITFSYALANAFWVFVGIVAGAFIQFALGRVQVRYQAKNAFRVMKAEIELNLDAHARFNEQIARLKELVSAGQLAPDELFISMQEFDYSAIPPLVSQGHFHFMLGPEKAKHYFEFMRFFNVGNSKVLTDVLRREHGAGRSIEAIRWIESRGNEVSKNLREIGNLKLKRGLFLGAPK